MAKIAIGFIKPSEKKGAEVKVILRGIEAEFDKMASLLELGREELARDLKVEKKIKRELVKIHKRIQKVEKKFQRRQNLFAQAYGKQTLQPRSALELLNNIDQIDDELGPEMKSIGDELEKHTIAELSLVYKGADLSKENIISIRSIANTLYNRLSQLNSHINLQETESIRRQIRFRHGE